MKNTPTTTQPTRTGATLTEVLVSLLIFSVGIVSVFTLFPVSLLSSIQATKLTNSKILADNIVDLVRTNPELLHPPVDPTASPAQTWKGFWKNNNSYSTGDVIWPSIQTGQLFPEPNLSYICTTAGTSSTSEPSWRTTGTVTDGSVTWTPMTAISNYVVDPFGFERLSVAPKRRFGFNGISNDGNLRRASKARDGNTWDASLFTQPDTWTVVFEALPTAVSTYDTTNLHTTLTFPTTIDLSVVRSSFRVVVTKEDGTASAVRSVKNVDLVNREVNIETAPLPGDMNQLSEIGNIRLETFAPRYSYLMTVRRTDFTAPPKVSVVVIFNRNVSVTSEELYSANFASPGTGFDGLPEITGSPNANQIYVAWDPDPSVEPPPLIREGNFIFDAQNAIWYRMVNVSGITQVSGKNQVTITVDRTIEVKTPATMNASDAGEAIFLPGIVEIFEL